MNLPPGKPLSVSKRKFFEEAKVRRELVFGLPLKSRVTGDWVMPMVRALQKSDGSFGGVVYLNTDIKQIFRVFQAIDVERWARWHFSTRIGGFIYDYPCQQGCRMSKSCV